LSPADNIDQQPNNRRSARHHQVVKQFPSLVCRPSVSVECPSNRVDRILTSLEILAYKLDLREQRVW